MDSSSYLAALASNVFVSIGHNFRESTYLRLELHGKFAVRFPLDAHESGGSITRLSGAYYENSFKKLSLSELKGVCRAISGHALRSAIMNDAIVVNGPEIKIPLK